MSHKQLGRVNLVETRRSLIYTELSFSVSSYFSFQKVDFITKTPLCSNRK